MIERAKIYSDGNHFIAIPETKSENRKRKSVVPKQYTDDERKALDKRNLLIRKIRFVRKAYCLHILSTIFSLITMKLYMSIKIY